MTLLLKLVKLSVHCMCLVYGRRNVKAGILATVISDTIIFHIATIWLKKANANFLIKEHTDMVPTMSATTAIAIRASNATAVTVSS